MDILGWLWWLASTLFTGVLSLIWFLISGWVSTLLQIALLVVVIYFLKYGWQRAPAEIWRRSRAFAGFFVGWIRAAELRALSSREAAQDGAGSQGEGVRRREHFDAVVAADVVVLDSGCADLRDDGPPENGSVFALYASGGLGAGACQWHTSGQVLS